MANLSSLASATTAATALSNLVLVTPQQTIGYQPQNPSGSTAQQPPALLFNYEGEQSVTLESDITDHFIEDNTAIADQIALKPEIVTTDGYIGELNDISPVALAALKAIADKLTIVNAYTPELSVTALLAYNEAFLLYQTAANAVHSAVSAWSSISGGGGENVIGSSGLEGGVFNAATGDISNNQNKQQVAFQQFYGYWRARTLFTVQTPWAVFKNMAIHRLQPIQTEETEVITNFKVSFKMMRFSDTTLTSGNAAILQGRAAAQAASLTNLGTTTLSPSISLASGLGSLGF